MGRDLSEQYKNEREKSQLQHQLQQAQKMEAIGQLTGGIAHDFNNILGSIVGFTGLALERSMQHTDIKLNEYLQQIQSSASQARDIVAQMLAFSRDSEINLVPLRLPSLVKEFSKILKSTMPSNIEIDYEYAPDLPCILANPVQLNQVILNLCINARDAIDDSGRIEIKLSLACYSSKICTSCRQTLNGNFLELSIRDSGKGIEFDHIEKIFDPFFSTKEISKNSGMGLAMVQSIMHKHAGHICVDSVPGTGSLFRLLFPPVDESIQPCDERGQYSGDKYEPRAEGRILVVDDDRSSDYAIHRKSPR